MNHHHLLKELAKVATGLVVADLISCIWLAGAGLFPMSIFGVVWTSAAVPEILVLDAALLILFVHLGWGVKLPVSSPSERTLLMLSGFLFLIIALLHLARLAFGLDLALGTFEIPLWLSWIGIVVTAYFSYASFHFASLRAR
ncbi:MAG TPA: hypothetical protein VHC68_01780 [Candidatus Paceibacterota bacterium]|nr:hypothetical protein [Candidatus Paceibacterota bacterium]